jgi:cytochrome bd ubiquinol oxidase subunit I
MYMDAVTLARLQFAITTIYHFFFVPLTLGLVILVAVMETMYVHSGDDMYKRMARFWGRLFLINFAMGVVTGIVLEFQFGMNWSTYSRFVGDIFGAPLAVEALFAFFMESTFLGIWMFGWERLSKRWHLVMIWLVVLGSHVSAFWILVANSFMQQPVGYVVRNGRAEMTNFFALLTNSNLWVQYPHVVMAGWATGAFFILGISAYHLLKKKGNQDFFQRSMRIGLIVGLVSSILVAVDGHLQAQHMVQIQPMKMAAVEALWDSEDPASFSLFTIGNLNGSGDVFSIRVPSALSVLAYNSFSGKVDGINQLQAQYVREYGPGDYVPPVPLMYWSFRIMIGAGMLMILLALLALFFSWRRLLERWRWFSWVLVIAIILPYLANATGWILTEVGRQPWIVFGLLQTSKAASPTVGTASVLISLIVFTLIYGALAVVDGYLLVKYAKADGTTETETPAKSDNALAQAY